MTEATRIHTKPLTEDRLASAIVNFVDANGYKMHASQIVCGSRAALRARSILADTGGVPFSGVKPSIGVKQDSMLNPDAWRLA